MLMTFLDILSQGIYTSRCFKSYLQGFRDAGLTVKPSKCFIGFSNIGFTGHVVGKGLVQMEEDKITKIKEAISQTTILRLPDFSRPFNTAV